METWGQTQKVHEKEMSDEEARRIALEEKEKESETKINKLGLNWAKLSSSWDLTSLQLICIEYLEN